MRSVLTPLLAAALALPATVARAEGFTIRNLGKGKWQLKQVESSTPGRNLLQVVEPAKPAGAAEEKAFLLPPAAKGGFQRVPPLEVLAQKNLTLAFPDVTRAAFQSYKLLDERRASYGLLQVLQTLDPDGKARLAVKVKADRGCEALVHQLIRVEGTTVFICKACWPEPEPEADQEATGE